MSMMKHPFDDIPDKFRLTPMVSPKERINWITPMAQLCPVCRGTGEFHPIDGDVKRCHGCFGKGWVTVQ